ncbi:MAG: hypothetical protein VYE40_19295 [Myxococcota bacterium]|nr:hypothetical protein [Myxococcota bacterium]
MDTIELKQPDAQLSLEVIDLEQVWRTIYRGDASGAARWFDENGARLERQLLACEPASEQGRALAITGYFFQERLKRLDQRALIDLLQASIVRSPATSEPDAALRIALQCGLAHLLSLYNLSPQPSRDLFTQAKRALEVSPALAKLDLMGITLEQFYHLCHVRLLLRERQNALARTHCIELLAQLQQPRAQTPWGAAREIWTLRGITEQWLGSYEESRESFLTAHIIAKEQKNWHQAVMTLALCAQVAHLESNLELAGETYASARALAAEHGLQTREELPIFVALVWAFFDLEDGRAEDAYRDASWLLEERCARAAMPRLLARVIIILALYCQDEHTMARAHHNVSSLELVHAVGPFDLIHRKLGVLLGRAAVTDEEQVRESSSRALIQHDDNLFVRFAQRALSLIEHHTAQKEELVYEPEGRWFIFPGEQQRVDFTRKHVPRRALLALIVASGEAMDRDALLAACWPDETLSHDSALTRLRTLVYQLREFGLREFLETTEEGYSFSPRLQLRAYTGD